MSTNGQVQPRLVLPVGHTKTVDGVAIDSSESKILSFSENEVNIWDLQSGKLLFHFVEHSDKVQFASFSTSGRKIIIYCADGHTYMRNLNNGQLINEFWITNNYVRAIYLNFDDSEVFVTEYINKDWHLKIYNSSNGLLLRNFDESLVGITRDFKKVITKSLDSNINIKIWGTRNGRIENKFKLPQIYNHSKVAHLSLNPDASVVIVCSEDSNSFVMPLIDNGVPKLIGIPLQDASFNTDGSIAILKGYNQCRIWDFKKNMKLCDIFSNCLFKKDFVNDQIKEGDTMTIIDAQFCANDTRISINCQDDTIRVFDANTAILINKYNGYGFFRTSSSRFIITYSLEQNNPLSVWDARNGKLISILNGYSLNTTRFEIQPNRRKIISGLDDGYLYSWNIDDGKPIIKFDLNHFFINSLSFSKDGAYLASTGENGGAQIWDFSTGSIISRIYDKAVCRSASFDNFSTVLLTAGRHGKIDFWDIKKNKFKFNQINKEKTIISAGFNFNDSLILIVSKFGGGIEVLDSKTSSSVFEISNSDNILQNISCVASANFNENTNLLVTSIDSVAEIWDWSKFRDTHYGVYGKNKITELGDLKGHIKSINSTSFSLDGEKIVTSSDDGTARIWNVRERTELHQLCGHMGSVISAKFTPDGKHVVTTGDDHKTILWDVESGKQLYTRLQLKNNDWLVYDEDYHFDGSEGAINYLYLTCGLEIIDLAQVKDSLWIRGLSGKIMRGEKLLINDKPAPKLSDLNICELTPIVEDLPKDAKGNLIFQITPRNGGLGETEVYINDNLTYKYQPEQLIKTKNKEGKIIYLLNLSKDSITPFLSGNKDAINPLLVKCKIKGASIYSRGATLEMVTEKDPELPKLYAVFVGVNDYNNMQKESNEFLYKNLDYAAKDAGDLANMVEQSAHTLFKDSAFIYRLTGKDNTEPTKDNLKKVLTEIGTKAKANDILYIFFAGHGDIVKFKNDKTNEEKNEIRFMLQGADKRNKNTGGFGVEELTDWCAPKNIKAQKRVFVFDACHSGQFVNETMAYAQGGRGDEEDVRIRQLTSLKDKNGMMILAASSDDEYAYEDASLNQGVLTYHLLEAVKDSKDSTLQVNRWFESTLDLVKEYATTNNRKQTPETFGNGRFEIGNVNNQVRDSIKIGAPKARVGVSVFIDPTGDADKKYPNLEKLVNEHYKQSGSRGDFISATTNEKAYYAKGSILLDNNKLKVRYTLYYGDTPIAEPFSMSELKGLSEEEVVKKIIASMEGGINEYIKKSKK